MAYHPDAIREKTRQGADVLYAFVWAVIAAAVVGFYGEPFLVRQLGSGAPWWVYAVLFVPFVTAVARVIMDDQSMHEPKRSQAARKSGALREQDDFEDSNWLGTRPQRDFVPSEIH